MEIQEAYDVRPLVSAVCPRLDTDLALQILKDEKKRAEYDKYGAASQQPGFNANAYENARSGFGSGGFGFGNFQDFSGAFGGARGGPRGDVFDQLFGMFGGASAGSGAQAFGRGGDVEATVGISFMEACKGTKRTITVTPIVKCTTCSGSGLKAGASRSTCSACGGTGVRSYVIDSGFHMQTTCTSCHGTGSTVPPSGQCDTCAGVGQVKVRKSVPIDIPAGEQQIRESHPGS